MQCLHVGVLGIDAQTAPHHGAAAGAQHLAFLRHAFAEAFHFELLQIRRQQGEAVFIGNYRARGAAAEIVVPQSDQAHQHGHVAFGRRFGEVTVHQCRSGEQFIKSRRSHGDHCGQAHRRPHRIPSADPVPHREQAFRGNAEGAGGIDVCSHCGKVGADISSLQSGEQPVLRGLGIARRLHGRKTFRLQDEQGGGGFQRREQPGHWFTRGGDEMHARRGSVWCAGAGNQRRPQRRAADAQADDIEDRLTGGALDPAGAQRIGKTAHRGERVAHFPRGGIAGPQGGMPCGAFFGLVDAFAGEQRGDAVRQIALEGQLHQQIARFGDDQVF